MACLRTGVRGATCRGAPKVRDSVRRLAHHRGAIPIDILRIAARPETLRRGPPAVDALATQVLLSENCDDGNAAGWTPLISGWQVSGGVYQATNGTPSVDTESYWSGGMAWTNYTATTKIMLEDPYMPSAGLLIMRYQAPNNRVDCQLLDASAGMSLVLSYATPGGGATLQEKVIGFSGNTWYTLRGTAIGSALSCEVLEIPGSLVSGSAPSAPATGTVALRNAHIQVSFDDVNVVAAP